MMEFIGHDEIGAERWDAVVIGSPDGWAYGTSPWRRLILDVPEWGLRDLSFAVRQGDKVLGVMPLQYQPASARAASTGWGYAGPIVAGDLTGDAREQAMAALVAHAGDLARQCGATALDIASAPLCRTSLEAPWGVNPMVAFGFEDTSTQSRVVDLTATEDALWAGLSANARQMVRKAEKAGYRAERGAWPARRDDYYRVHVETYERTGVPPHPRRYFDGIAAHMAPAGYAALWVGLAPDGRPVAFHNDTRFNGASLYATGCAETAHLDSGINYLLFWAAMLDARRDGCVWYDIGEVFPGAQDGKSRGLTVFKSKFGGALHRNFKSRLTLAAAPVVADAPAPGAAAVAAAGPPDDPWRTWLRATRAVARHLLGPRA